MHVSAGDGLLISHVLEFCRYDGREDGKRRRRSTSCTRDIMCQRSVQHLGGWCEPCPVRQVCMTGRASVEHKHGTGGGAQ
jgi:hypothetical protein